MAKRRKSVFGWIWRILLCVILLPFLLFISAVLLLLIPSVQKKAVDTAAAIISDATGMEISISHLGLKLPLDIDLQDVLVKDADGGTILELDDARLSVNFESLKKQVIDIDALRLSGVTLDTRSLIRTVRIDGNIGELFASSDSTLFRNGSITTLLNDVRLRDADVGVTLTDSLDESITEDADSLSQIPDWQMDIRHVCLENIGFQLDPMDISAHVDTLETTAFISLMDGMYNVISLRLDNGRACIGQEKIGLAAVDLAAAVDLNRMQLECTASLNAEDADIELDGTYDIAGEAYSANIDIRGLCLNRFLPLDENCTFSGHIKADGHGFDIFSKNMLVNASVKADDFRYGAARLGGTSLNVRFKESVISGKSIFSAEYADTSFSASTHGDVTFRLSEWDSNRFHLNVATDLRDIFMAKDTDSLYLSTLSLQASTSGRHSDVALEIPGISINAEAEEHILALPEHITRLTDIATRQLDSLDFDISVLKTYFPTLNAQLRIDRSSQLNDLLRAHGIDFGSLTTDIGMSPSEGITANAALTDFSYDTLTVRTSGLRIRQVDDRMNCIAEVDFDSQHRLPAFSSTLEANVGIHESDARLRLNSDISDGVLSASNLRCLLGLDISGTLTGDTLRAAGELDIDNLNYGGIDFGDRIVELGLTPADRIDRYHIFARLQDFPLSIVTSLIDFGNMDIGIDGAVDGEVTLDGQLDSLALGGSIIPRGVRAHMEPYGVDLSLAEKPVRYVDGKVVVNEMEVYGIDSTCMTIDGALDIAEMTANFKVRSSGFRPAALEPNDSLPFYGHVSADIDATVTGPVDSLRIAGSIGIPQTTELTYIIDKENNVFAKANGTLEIDMIAGGDISLTGRVNIPEGSIRYSPPYYPLLPFSISPDSYVEFNGDVSKPVLDILATQPAKATVKTVAHGTRSVDFSVGLKVTDDIDNLGLKFIIEALDDEEIQKDLASLSAEERESVAAAMLATGMYASVTNEAAMNSSYALTSIMQSRLNAFTTNKMKGRALDIDLGIGEATHGGVTGTDYSVQLSRSFFDDRLTVSVGGRMSDKKQSNGANSFIDNASLQWQLKKGGNSYLNVFHKIDFENIIDGELEKDGIGFMFDRQWKGREGVPQQDALSGKFEGNFSHRSNLQIGPDIAVTLSRRNLLHHDETLSAKLTGAYFWNYRDKSRENRSKVDSYHFGIDLALSYPKIILPWKSIDTENFASSTTYGIGYMQEHVAGGYTLNKITASLTHQFRTSKYVSHTLSPLSLSIVSTINAPEMYTEHNLSDKRLSRNFVRDEFIPAIQYRFSYDNSSDRSLKTTTRFDASIKESGNLTSALQALLGFKGYSQFVRFSLELRNLFRLTEHTSIATRMFAGSIISYGNSVYAPLSESFYSGGPNSIRAFAQRSLGPGNYHSGDTSEPYYLHGGETRLELNAEYRFPIVGGLEGAVFLDAGNTWNNHSLRYGADETIIQTINKYLEIWDINSDYNGCISIDRLLDETALGTGLGMRYVFQSLVIRFDLGIALHAPYNTGKTGYYNIPNFWKDGLRLNFAIGYPF